MSLYFRIKAGAVEVVTKLTHCPKCAIPASGKFCPECAQPLNIVNVKELPGLELIKGGDFFSPQNSEGCYTCYIKDYMYNDTTGIRQSVIPHKEMLEMITTLESHGITDFVIIFSH